MLNYFVVGFNGALALLMPHTMSDTANMKRAMAAYTATQVGS